MMRRVTAPVAVVLFVILALAYIAFSPSLVNQHWDSLEYAYRCEAPGPVKLWGNHPLGHVVLCGVFRIARGFGYSGRAMPLLQTVNAVIGALAVVAFMGLLGRVSTSRVRVVGWTLAFGATYGMWRFAGTADVYALSVLVFLLAWIAVLRFVDAPSAGAAVAAGALVGLALVTHQFTGPVLAAGMVGLVPYLAAAGSRAVPTRLGLLLVAAAIVGGGLYYGLGVFATGSTSFAVIRQWIVGYGADPLYGRYLNPTGLMSALASSTETLIRTSWVPGLLVLRVVIPALLLATAIAGIVLARRLPQTVRVIVQASACQLVIGWIVVAWWEPYHVGKFWLLLLPAFVVLAAAGVEALSARTRIVGWMPLVVALFFVYLNSEGMRREHAANAAFERTLDLWIGHSRPDDVLIESDELTAHLLFWGQRPNTVNLYRALESGSHQGDPFASLKKTIDDALTEGRTVILAPDLGRYYNEERLRIVGTNREEVLAFFKRYRWIGPLFQYESRSGGEPKPAYRLM